MTDTPYFFRRNRDQGQFPYMWAIVTSAVYHPYVYIYGKKLYLSADFNTPHPRGGDNKPTDFSG